MISRLIGGLFIVVVLLTVAAPRDSAAAQSSPTGIDMPFKLVNGHIRTPEFKMKTHEYFIDVWIKADLTNDKWRNEKCCVNDAVGADRTLVPIPGCGNGTGRRIQATWTLWDGNDLVGQGPRKEDTPICDSGGVTMMDFFLGRFHGKRGKRYVLDVELRNLDPNIPFTDARLKVWPQPEMVIVSVLDGCLSLPADFLRAVALTAQTCSQGALAKAEPMRSAASTSNSACRRPAVPVRVGAGTPLQEAEHPD